MTEEFYFFDSYAIIEIVYENKNYRSFSNKNPILTKLNLFEIFYHILRESGEEDANKIFQIYLPSVVEYDETVIKGAAKFRLEHKKRDLSMTDCIGYIVALKLGVRFLTGDKEFKDFENVEFVK